MTIPNTMPRLYRISRKHVVPGTTVVLLSDTTKMDCPSWGIPAITYCPWAGECRFFCYAKKGQVQFEVCSGRAESTRRLDARLPAQRSRGRMDFNHGCRH